MMDELVIYAGGVPPLPAEKQRVWNLIGQGKTVMDKQLQVKTLELQQCLTGYETMEQPALAEAIKLYKGTWNAMVEVRKVYTRYLDLCKEQCCQPEKTYEPETNPVFKAAVTRELSLREEVANKLKAEKIKVQETADFKTFVVNQYHDITSQYRNDLAQIIHQTYTACLSAKTPPDNVQGAINTCVAAMRDVKPRLMEKFQRKKDEKGNNVITDQECSKLFDEVPKPNLAVVYSEAIANLQAKFSLYANDLANPTAIVQQTNLFEQEQTQAQQHNEATKAANTLVAQATSFVVAPAGFKGVTEVTEIKVEDYDWNWAAKIIAAFLANFEACTAKTRVKKCSSLTVAQMAAALDAASVKVEGITYQTLKK